MDPNERGVENRQGLGGQRQEAGHHFFRDGLKEQKANSRRRFPGS